MGSIADFFFAKAVVGRMRVSISSMSLEVEIGGASLGGSLVDCFEDKRSLGFVFVVNSLLETASMGTPSKARSLDKSLNGGGCCTGVLLRTCLRELDTSWLYGQ